MENDVAIIKIDSNANLPSNAQPICLSSTPDPSGTVLVSGWGTEKTGKI